MGIKHNFTDAKLRLDKTFLIWDDSKSKIVRLSALEIFRRLVVKSPVDTGFYRSSHDVTIGAISSFVPPKSKKGGKGKGGQNLQDRFNEASTRLAGVNSVKGGITIYFTNNAPYANALEHGHSQQAPQGIYQVVAGDVPIIIKKAERLVLSTRTFL
jgi:hypothetical protein